MPVNPVWIVRRGEWLAPGEEDRLFGVALILPQSQSACRNSGSPPNNNQRLAIARRFDGVQSAHNWAPAGPKAPQCGGGSLLAIPFGRQIRPRRTPTNVSSRDTSRKPTRTLAGAAELSDSLTWAGSVAHKDSLLRRAPEE